MKKRLKTFNVNEVRYIRVCPLEPSAAPKNVAGRNLSATSINVTWEAPDAVDHNGVIINYTIYYQSVGEDFLDNTTRRKIVGFPTTEAVLTGLKEYVEYNISVSASTSVGEGPASASVIVRTAEAGK